MQQERLNHLNFALGRTITFKTQQHLYFGGTAYLGIPQCDDFLSLYVKGIKKYGLNNGTSRGNNIQLGIYDEAENCAAKRFGAEAALITSSGYLAVQLIVKKAALLGEVRYTPDTHPALWVNENPNVKGSFNNWANNIVAEINASEKESWVIITNSINNLYPQIYDFSFIKKLNKQVLLVVDDSHGIGIINNGLGALISIPNCNNVNVVIVASMAKALGVDAGLILGSVKMIKLLKQSNEFLGASPPSAAGLYAFINATEIYTNELKKLKSNIDLLNSALIENTNWDFIPDFPVYLAKNADISTVLEKEGILISAFPYPDKDGPIINRIVLSSWHSTLDIEQLINAIKIK